MPFISEDGSPIPVQTADAIYIGGVHIDTNSGSLVVDLWAISGEARHYLQGISLSAEQIAADPVALPMWLTISDAIEQSAPAYASMLTGLVRVSEEDLALSGAKSLTAMPKSLTPKGDK